MSALAIIARYEAQLTAAEEEAARAQGVIDALDEGLAETHAEIDALQAKVHERLGSFLVGDHQLLPPAATIDTLLNTFAVRFGGEGASLLSLEQTIHDALGYVQGGPLYLWQGVEALIERIRDLDNELDFARSGQQG
jgi:hypothetical protein